MKETRGAAGPVTVVITRLVKQGREREYEEWLAGIAEQMSAFEGFAGLELMRPVDGLQPDVDRRIASVEHEPRDSFRMRGGELQGELAAF
jgi:antibiotic biosynthesis monooxygenase (ABM) superfamily enzyme